MGRRLYDLTNGWGGHPGNEAPIVVLTRSQPDTQPDGVPFYFFSEVEAAVARARDLTGELDVAVAGPRVAQAGARRRLLDVIDVSLVPVVSATASPGSPGRRDR